MATPKLKQFKVQGRGSFPLDMLRYDVCWPTTGVDTSAMVCYPGPGYNDQRTVTLSTHSASAPTIGRWESFGWRVIEN